MGTRKRNESARHLTTGDVLVALAVGLAGGLWLAWLDLHSGSAAVEQGPIGHTTTVVAFTAPLVLAVVSLTLSVVRDRRWSMAAAVRIVPVAAVSLAVGNDLRLVVLDEPTSGLPVVTLADDALVALVVVVPVTAVAFAVARARSPRVRAGLRSALAVGVGALTVVGLVGLAPGAAGAASRSQAAAASPNACLDGGDVDRSFDVTAIDVNIPINRFGDHDPKGKMYALDVAGLRDPCRGGRRRRCPSACATTRSSRSSSAPTRATASRSGFTNNATGGTYGMHIDGLEFDVDVLRRRDRRQPRLGVAAGRSRDVPLLRPARPPPRGRALRAPRPRLPRRRRPRPVRRARWSSRRARRTGTPSTAGQPLQSGWEAIIKPGRRRRRLRCRRARRRPARFREAALLHHEIGNDNEQLKTARNGSTCRSSTTRTGSYRPGAFALNYRSEPFRNRLLAFPKEKAHAYSSYTFGEPATPMHARLPRRPDQDPAHARRQREVPRLPPARRRRPVALQPGRRHDLQLRQDRAAQGPRDRAVAVAAARLPVDRPGRVLQPRDRGRRRRRPAVGRRLPVPLPHRQALRLGHVGLLARLRHRAARPRAPLRDRPPPPPAVDSRGLIGRTVDGTTLTDGQPRRLDPAAAAARRASRATGRTPTVWNWKVAGDRRPVRSTSARPRTRPSSPTRRKVVAGQPEPAAGRRRAHRRRRPADDPVQPGQRPAGVPAAAHRTSASDHRSRQRATPGTPWLGDNAGPELASGDATRTPTATTGSARAGAPAPHLQHRRDRQVDPAHPDVRRPRGQALRARPRQGRRARQTRDARDPLAIRANQGDCVAVTLTNEIPDASAFDKFSKIEHAHPPRAVRRAGLRRRQHRLRLRALGAPVRGRGLRSSTAPRPAGDTVLHLSDVTKFVGHRRQRQAHAVPGSPSGRALESIDIHQVVSVDQVATDGHAAAPRSTPRTMPAASSPAPSSSSTAGIPTPCSTTSSGTTTSTASTAGATASSAS